MIESSVSRRYARALIEVASQDGRHEKVGAELDAIASTLALPEARALIANPAFSETQRRGFVTELARRLALSPLTATFLSLLVDKQRITALQHIALVYRDLLDEKIGRVRATVTSALPLADADLARVREALADATRRNVVLEAKTDPAIIGGLVAQVGAVVWDGSLRTQLERLRDELKQAPL